MRNVLGILGALAIVLAGASAYGGRPAGQVGGVSIYEKPRHLIFEEDEVTVGLDGPAGEIIDVPTVGRFGTLISVRDSFYPELLKAAEDL
jgi:hypothetical protein